MSKQNTLSLQNSQNMLKVTKLVLNPKMSSSMIGLDLYKLDIKSACSNQVNFSSTTSSLINGKGWHSQENIYQNNNMKNSKLKDSSNLLNEENEEHEIIPCNRGYNHTTKTEHNNRYLQISEKIRSNIQNRKISSNNQKTTGSPKISRLDFLKSCQIETLKNPYACNKKRKSLVLTLHTTKNIHNQVKICSPSRSKSDKEDYCGPFLRKDSSTLTFQTQNAINDKNNGTQTQNCTHNIDQIQLTEQEPKKYNNNGCPITNTLDDMGSTSSYQLQKLKTQVKNINNFANKFYIPKEASNQDNEFIQIFQEKGTKITKLNTSQIEFKQRLNHLMNEEKEIRKMKLILKDKERIIKNIENSINEALMESQYLRKDLLKTSEYIANPSLLDKDLESLKNQKQENINLELLQKNISPSKSNSSINSFFSDLNNRPQRNSVPINSLPNPKNGQRKYSRTIGDILDGNQIQSSDDELINNKQYHGKNSIDQNQSIKLLKARPNTGTQDFIPMSVSNKNLDLQTEIPRLETRNNQPKNLKMLKNNQISFQYPDLKPNNDLQKTKFSQNSKINHENAFSTFFDKNNSNENILTYKTNSNVKLFSDFLKHKSKLDIAIVLNSFKEKIKNLLNQHKDKHEKLLKINESFSQQLETINDK